MISHARSIVKVAFSLGIVLSILLTEFLRLWILLIR
ncbi:hypothetical protein HUW46_00663 [Amycolatopsis sp. CA-230715]|nr:hypothetical protein HUW46_00663 [Amycolatopsis sp. CA-230715]